MKKSVVSLVLIGVFFLVPNLIFAQGVPPANGDNLTAPADTQANADMTTPSADQVNTDAGDVPSNAQVNDVQANDLQANDTQANTDTTTPPADTQENTDTTTSPDQLDTNATSAPADTQANPGYDARGDLK